MKEQPDELMGIQVVQLFKYLGTTKETALKYREKRLFRKLKDGKLDLLCYREELQ